MSNINRITENRKEIIKKLLENCPMGGARSLQGEDFYRAGWRDEQLEAAAQKVIEIANGRNYVVCPECSGNGAIQTEYYPEALIFKRRYATCTHCNGWGLVPEVL